MMQAARDVLNRAEEVIAANQEAIRQAVKDIATFSASLARNSDNVDIIVSDAKDTMKNAKEATASARTLMDNLDKRTEEITVGVNRMTSTATRQIDIAGRAITDLAHNPQRFLFGGSGSSSSSSSSDSNSSASSPPPAPPPARTPPARTPTPPPAPARAQR
jgi:phospholipid/cholesterol/gamma-HCH transport system substrate-binding protein